MTEARLMTPAEAQECLLRFCNSHFNNKGDHARASIPADPNRDDDILMARFIDWAKERDNDAKALGKLMSENPVEVSSGVDELERKTGIRHVGVACLLSSFEKTLGSAPNFVTLECGGIEITLKRKEGKSPAERLKQLTDALVKIAKHTDSDNLECDCNNNPDGCIAIVHLIAVEAAKMV